VSALGRFMTNYYFSIDLYKHWVLVLLDQMLLRILTVVELISTLLLHGMGIKFLLFLGALLNHSVVVGIGKFLHSAFGHFSLLSSRLQIDSLVARHC
jgi:hypothetical protein